MQQTDTDSAWFEAIELQQAVINVIFNIPVCRYTVWQRYLVASGTERDNLAYCLAQTKKQWLIKRCRKSHHLLAIRYTTFHC